MVFHFDFYRIAWEDKNVVHFRPESGQLFHSSVRNVNDSENKSQGVKEQAVKIARSISIFGLSPGLYFTNILEQLFHAKVIYK